MSLAPINLLGGIHIDHPGHFARERGEETRFYLAVTVGKSPTLREIPLTEHDILKLLRDGVQALDLMRRYREEGL